MTIEEIKLFCIERKKQLTKLIEEGDSVIDDLLFHQRYGSLETFDEIIRLIEEEKL